MLKEKILNYPPKLKQYESSKCMYVVVVPLRTICEEPRGECIAIKDKNNI